MKTILKMLQEMAYYSEIKMDWNELVKKTTTGITNAREYQSLWRHLSYRHPLLPVEDDAQPLVLFWCLFYTVLMNCKKNLNFVVALGIDEKYLSLI